MAPKKKRGKTPEDSKKTPSVQKNTNPCAARAPGPKYKLKPLVGYDDHCASRYRNPAYSIAAKQIGGTCTAGPGPIYYVDLPKAEGFTIGHALRGAPPPCGPGPYLPSDPPRRPAFTMKWRTEYRGGGISAGPYDLPSGLNGPSYTIGQRPTGDRCGGPGPSPPFSVDVIKPRAPRYTFGWRQTDSVRCAGPGPYDPYQNPKFPKYSFGVKHSPCSPPYITECDDVC